MKKVLIGAFVGAFILFVFQAAMWMGGFNNGFFTYTDKQDALMEGINQHLDKSGLYFMPMPDPALNLSHEQEEAYHKDKIGKPWAMIFYHSEMHGMDPMYLVKGFLHNLIGALIVSLVLFNGKFGGMGRRFMVSFGFGIFALTLGAMNQMNWWDLPWSYIRPQVIDFTLGWGLVSLWLAKYVKQ